MSPITSIADSFSVWLLAVPISIIALIFITWTSNATKDDSDIPSPKVTPVLDDALEISRTEPWIKFTQWGDKLGPLFKLNILNRTHVIISDENLAQTLLEDRGVQYSDRPWSNFTCGLLTGNLHLLLLSNNERFHRYRSFLDSVMSTTAASKYDSIQSIEVKRMLDSFISAPNQYDRWIDRFSSSLTARLVWGKRVETGEEEFLRTLHDITNTFEQVGSRGSQLYNRFPSLLLLPDWIAPLKRTARRLHMWEANFLKRLVNDTRLDMAAGTAQPSFARQFIENKAANRLSEIEGAYALGGVFEAGAEVTAAQMKSFCLALCLYPEWQDKMQTEIDAICGDRMPEFSDMPSLPVTRAILVEVARWRPACPGGLPHVLSQDDTYNSYHFAAQTIFHPNIWAMTHNPSLYPSPHTFNPARWLTPSYPTFRSPLSHHPSLSLAPMPIFGYGPRRCPGRHIAARSLFIQAASIGWACTLRLSPGAAAIHEDALFASSSSAAAAATVTESMAAASGLGTGSGSGGGLGKGRVVAPQRWEFDVVPRKGRELVVHREAMAAAEADPLAGGGGRGRVERIAFKREGGWNPSF